jgi:sorting nexin-8
LQQITDQENEPIALGATEILRYKQSDAEADRRRYDSIASDEQNPPGPRQEQRDLENTNLDPGLERKKRRKITSFDESETASSQSGTEGTPDGGRSWLAQLQAAAHSSSAESQGQSDVNAGTIESPRTPLSATPVKLVIRKSPMKTPGKPQFVPDTPANTPPSSLRTTAQSGSSGSKRAPSPGLGPTPMKKVIKLTSKGKLLSSPPPANPVTKRMTRSKNTKATGRTSPDTRKPTRLGYGTDEESKTRIGNRINSILSVTADITRSSQTKSPKPLKSTHPFFLGKAVKKGKSEVVIIDDDSTTVQDSDADEKLENAGAIKPKNWEDLGFKKNTMSVAKVIDAIPPLWPPKYMQHLNDNSILPTVRHDHQVSSIRQRSSKSRMQLPSVTVDEDVLQKFALTLDYETGQLRDPYPLPQKMVLSRQIMINTIKDNLSAGSGPSGLYALQDLYPQAFERMEFKLLSDTSPKDDFLGAIAQSWLSNSAPQRTGEVLQSQSTVLRTWLASHQIHSTATKLPTVQKARRPHKRRRKKRAEDLDDFIDDSDEDERSTTTAKNAILITGPSGCGKTASVYAAAKELDFEVFEIHPGMRRSAKDIFDRVGDMTQNHLVHKAAELDRTRESPSDEAVSEASADKDIQRSNGGMKAFLGSKKSMLRKAAGSLSRSRTPEDKTDSKQHNRKQSLILFEEVDILFEEDRGFWSGVIQLVEQSKRPAVLTCNDPTSVPVEDLPLHAILEYEEVPVDVAVDYVLMLAGTEGHFLQREAIRLLYLTLQKDLRATISELSFWCQMAVGSEKAGLDWSVEARPSEEALKPIGQRLKLCSKDTYLSGMGLVPRTLISRDRSKQGALLQYAEDELGIPLQDWQDRSVERLHCDITAKQYSDFSTIQLLEHQLELTETRSTLDLLNQPVDVSSDVESMHQAAINAELAAAALSVFNPQAASVSVAEIIPAHLQVKAGTSLPPLNALATAFEPLMVEKLQFPSSSGRLAPSLDTSSASLMTDIAPYIRSIVRYDQRLEVQRNVLAGALQGTKTRKTRAARAALEGGSKASTRDEKWFPKKTDYAAILRTGGSWPLWAGETTEGITDESSTATGSRTESTATSPAADVEMIDET